MTEKFEMKLMETLIPNKIENIKVMDAFTTHTAAHVKFNLSHELSEVRQHLMYDMQLQSQWDSDENEWKHIDNPKLDMKDGYLAIDKLEYPNTIYRLRIRMKSNIANDTDEMWSSFIYVTIKTKPKIPDVAPETCVNCFNVMDNGNVVVYWKRLPEFLRNGDNFTYLIRGWNQDEQLIINKHHNETFIVLDRHIAKSIRLNIHSANYIGISQQFNAIYIPFHKLISERYLQIRKEIADSTEYKISWKMEQKLNESNFTVIWCHQRNELPNQCDGSINFQHVSLNKMEFHLKSNKSLQFGVAVNLKSSENFQGFEWAECTASKQSGMLQTFLITKNKFKNILTRQRLDRYIQCGIAT